jgi:hypothetical protein
MNTLDTDHANAFDKSTGDIVSGDVSAANVSASSAVIVDGAGSFQYSGTAPTITRLQAMGDAQSDGKWVWNFVSNTWRQDNVSAAGVLNLPMNNLVDIGTLKTVVVRLIGKLDTGAGHSALPGTLPNVALYKRTDASATFVQSQTDTSASSAAYDAAHDVTITVPGSPVIDETAQYVIQIQGETGTNSVASTLGIISVRATFTAAFNMPGG